MICSIKVRHLEDDRFCFCHFPAFYLVALVVKNPPAMREMRVWSLGQEDPLEKEMATHSTIPACRIPWTEEPGGLQSMGLQSRIWLKWLSTAHIYLTLGKLPKPSNFHFSILFTWKLCKHTHIHNLKMRAFCTLEIVTKRQSILSIKDNRASYCLCLWKKHK